MTNTPHDFEPTWHAQANKAVGIFGMPAVPNSIGIHAFVWRNPAAGASNSSGVAVESASSVGTSGTSGFLARSFISYPTRGTSTVIAGASINAIH